ncbi:MAG TPA: glycine cleavage T C-terminal barrel domain-containing protein [Gemmatimonadales bacterium]|nr:glycine cleavage T C-terminal barrel domain-containing protein [Gemmatimonadales bacterium]
MSPFDMSLVQRGARLRRSPFYEAEQRHGPRGYTVYNHMLFPTCYDDFEAEFWHLLNHVTLWDVAVERCLEVSGPDGFRLAQLMTPRDLSKCAVGQAKYVLICAADGGILNDPVMTRMSEDRFWFALASSDALFYAKGLAARGGLDVEIREAEAHPLQIQGPKARDVVRALFGDSILDLKYYFFREAAVDGIPVIVTRTGWTSEVGYEVYLLDGSRGTDLWEKILEAGRPFDIRPTGPSDIRRIEGGIFNWGADMTWEHNPFELGLERLVDFAMAGECAAMPALRRIKGQGVSRRMAGVVFDGAPFPALNFTKWPAESGGRAVGQVTSAIYSPRLRQNIGFCWLPVELATPGTTVTVESEWGTRTAKVTPMPFVDPEKRIPVSV